MLKRTITFAKLLAFACALSTLPAFADDGSEVMRFREENGSIVATGVISNETPQLLETFLAEQGKADGQWNTVMYLSSPGGDLIAALNMGNMLRQRGISTAAFGVCASACTYMLMGGVNRVVTKDAQYGVHRFFAEAARQDPQKPFYTSEQLDIYQTVVAELFKYASDMGVDTEVVRIASGTNEIVNLTRQQILDYKVENVPTDAADGQPFEKVVIPGVTAEAPSTSLYESLQLNEAALRPLAQLVSEALVRRVIMAETQDSDGMAQSLNNTYAINVEYNGRLQSSADVLAEKARIVREWGWRRRQIDDASLKTTCAEDDISCVVTGSYIYEFGLAEGLGSNVTNRWNFEYEVILPMALPRVSRENIALGQ